MEEHLQSGRLAILASVIAVFLAYLPISHAQQNQAATGVEGNSISDLTRMSHELERKKVELETRRVEIEAERLADARSGAWWTRAAIVIPIFIGLATLLWQARTAYRLKEIESDVAFQLHAAEVILSSKSTKAAEVRAQALHKLFPRRINDDFMRVFEENNFKLPGTAYQEKKLELFKAMASTLDDRKEIFRTYAMIYADEESILLEFVDKWEKVFPEDSAWVADFTQKWTTAFPGGRWEKNSGQRGSETGRLRHAGDVYRRP